jgi:hypothetical protein
VTGRPSDNYYRALEGRLRALLPRATSLLAEEVITWFIEYLDVGEYGLAVEVAAEGLPPEASTGSQWLAVALLAEAELMGITGPAVSRLRELAGSDQPGQASE